MSCNKQRPIHQARHLDSYRLLAGRALSAKLTGNLPEAQATLLIPAPLLFSRPVFSQHPLDLAPHPPACRDQQGATAYDMCIGDAARGLLEEKEAGLSAGARSRPVRYVCWLLLSCGCCSPEALCSVVHPRTPLWRRAVPAPLLDTWTPPSTRAGMPHAACVYSIATAAVNHTLSVWHSLNTSCLHCLQCQG